MTHVLHNSFPNSPNCCCDAVLAITNSTCRLPIASASDLTHGKTLFCLCPAVCGCNTLLLCGLKDKLVTGLGPLLLYIPLDPIHFILVTAADKRPHSLHAVCMQSRQVRAAKFMNTWALQAFRVSRMHIFTSSWTLQNVTNLRVWDPRFYDLSWPANFVIRLHACKRFSRITILG